MIKHSVAETIQSRRTIKKFKQAAVPLELITELLEVAVWTPNHKMREPWRFIAVVEDGRKTLVETMKRVSESGKMGKPMNQAKIDHLLSIPAFVLVVMEEDPRPMIWEEDFAAVSALIQNFQLAAWERGLGMLWNTNSVIYSPEFREEFDVKPGEKIVAIMQIGYPAFVPKPMERISAKEKLTVFSK